jgi:hypothetical protein
VSRKQTLIEELRDWTTRSEPWTGPATWTGEDGYNAAIEEVAGMLNYHRDEEDSEEEARRLLGYLWTATGKNHLRPVSDLFAEDDPIVADVERLAIFAVPVR